MTTRNSQLAKEFTDHFSRAVNCFLSKDELEEIATMIVQDHRTLQQNKMRLIVTCLKKWAEMEENGYFDLRNEATVKLARKLVDVMDEGEFYLPSV